jgi:mRNA interferase HigB
MRVITTKRLRDYAQHHPTIAPTLNHWTELILRTNFNNFVELRRVFPSADQATVASGRTITIFNIKTHYRLITAIHYNYHIVYILLLLTHAEYDQDRWKRFL